MIGIDRDLPGIALGEGGATDLPAVVQVQRAGRNLYVTRRTARSFLGIAGDVPAGLIRMEIRPEALATLEGEVAIEGRGPARLSTFVYP